MSFLILQEEEKDTSLAYKVLSSTQTKELMEIEDVRDVQT